MTEAVVVAHLAAAWALVGLTWTVSRVVYAGFARVVAETGPEGWRRVHAGHVAAIGPVVGLPWAVQGVTTAVLLLAPPDGVPLPLLLLDGACAAATVALTVLVAVPAHGRLSDRADDRDLALLRRAQAWRTAAWSAAAGCATAVAVLALAPPSA